MTRVAAPSSAPPHQTAGTTDRPSGRCARTPSGSPTIRSAAGITTTDAATTSSLVNCRIERRRGNSWREKSLLDFEVYNDFARLAVAQNDQLGRTGFVCQRGG